MKKYTLEPGQEADLERNFMVHPNRDGWAEKFEMINEKTSQLARQMYMITPKGPEQTLALRKLQEAQFWFEKAIKTNEF